MFADETSSLHSSLTVQMASFITTTVCIFPCPCLLYVAQQFSVGVCFQALEQVSFFILHLVIMPSEKVLTARLNMDLIKQLQTTVAPQIFTPKAVYDGRKNLFAIRELPFGPEGSKEASTPTSLIS